MGKIVIAGGTGFLGNILVQHFAPSGYEMVILTRGENRTIGSTRLVHWDGKTPGPWVYELEHADALINLNGKSVDCRYTQRNKALIFSTRLDSTALLGEAIRRCQEPPGVWLNAASATIYRHSLDKEMDEYTGEIGTGFSVDVCKQWEGVFNQIKTEHTRKVILRTGIVLGKNGGPLVPLLALARLGLGGKQGKGNQYFSWLHEDDFACIVEFLIKRRDQAGPFNITAPQPISNTELMRTLRAAVGISFGIPLPRWLLEFGAVLIRTETELILKSRRVVPKKLLEAGYEFAYPEIKNALETLVRD